MQGAAARAARRVGLRGAALLATGIGWITYGAGVIAAPRYPVTRGVVVLTHLRPLHWWVGVWIACGVVAILASAFRAGRDTWGFAAAALPPIVWAAAYLAGWASGSYPQAWASIPAWCVPVVLLVVVAALSARLTRALRTIRRLRGEGGAGGQ